MTMSINGNEESELRDFFAHRLNAKNRTKAHEEEITERKEDEYQWNGRVEADGLVRAQAKDKEQN